MSFNTRSSESVYVGMCEQLGTPTEVRHRREVIKTGEFLWRPIHFMRGLENSIGGSLRDGFMLETSDVDTMYWPPDHKVICDPSQISIYRIPHHTVILMEYEDAPPGSTKLRLLTPSGDPKINSSCIIINGETYILSSLFRARLLDYSKVNVVFARPSIQHGPCAAMSVAGMAFDHAYCFHCNYWPPVALPWIKRCQLNHWPSDCVLSEIVKEGCHVVPISSLPLDPERDSEWRISFSGAEHKLVHSMNHCQFICYGMLKIFLTEVINTDISDPCLCSYFIKTLMFWAIQLHSPIKWKPCNLLSCFWTCFKLLISWVYKGECPNFFIPQNNMFRVKVVGHKRAALFEKLYALYNEGIICLMLSPTIGEYLEKSIHYKYLTPGTEETRIVSDYYIDVCLFMDLNRLLDPYTVNTEEFARVIIALEQLQKTRSTSMQAISVQYFRPKLLRNYCFMSRQKLAIYSNRTLYYLLKIMKLAVKIGCVSEIVYLALYYYSDCHYERSLRCLQKAQERLTPPYTVYFGFKNEKNYKRVMKGRSLIDRMKKSLIYDITLNSGYAYFVELSPEQLTNRVDGAGILYVPPLVMVHMLFFLNHHRMGNEVRSQRSIQDLHTLLLNDDGTHVPEDLRDISWQILGICQQTCGDYVGALNSFQCSRQEYPFNCIKKATVIRILTIFGRLLQKY